jgi:hypothetical protein
VGHKAKKELNDPANALSDKQVKSFLTEIFPGYPVLNLPAPSELAYKVLCKNKRNVTKAVVLEAASYFRVPKNTKIIVIMPEYFCRKELAKHKKFQVVRKDASGEETVVGVRPSCPWCESNAYIEFRCFEIQNTKNMPRAGVDVDATMIPLFGARYWCKSFTCVGRVPKGKVDDRTRDVTVSKVDDKGNISSTLWCRDAQRVSDHSFVSWSSASFNQYPNEVKATFAHYVYGLAEEGEPKRLPSPQLALNILNTRNSFASIGESLEQAFELKVEQACSDYHSFVQEFGQEFSQPTKQAQLFGAPSVAPVAPKTVTSWPAFDRKTFKAEFGPPKAEAIDHMFWACYNTIEPFLDRDLYSRSPGRLLRWDGTFNLANKLIDVPELDSIGALLIIVGEWGDIMWYAFADAEGDQNWQIAHFFLMKRCERMGHKQLHAVVDGFDDLGSGTLKDPRRHWFAKIWPNVKRAPRKDCFHGGNRVLKSTVGATHPINDAFSKKLGGALLYFPNSEISKATTQFVKENPNVRQEVAKELVRTNQRFKRKMCNATWKPERQRKLVEEARHWAKIESSKYEKEGYPSYFKKATPTSRSTDEEMDYLISHIDRGDYQDPFSSAEMNLPLVSCSAENVDTPRSKGGMPDLIRLRGTNTSESTNKVVNRSMQNATRMRQILGAAKAKLRIHLHNLMKDRMFGGKTGRIAKNVLWMLREANWQMAQSIDGLESDASIEDRFPPSKPIEEPIGLKFMYYKNYLTHQEQHYLEGVLAGETPRLPVAAAPTNSASMDLSPDGDDDFNDDLVMNFDLDGAVEEHRQRHAVAEELPVAADSNEELLATLRTVSEQSSEKRPATRSPAATSTSNDLSNQESQSKKRRVESEGSSVWNRKPGNRALPSPVRMSVTLPMNSGQLEQASRILATLATDGSPQRLITTTGTAKLLREAWNKMEFASCLTDGKSFGGTMTLTVADSVVRSVLNTQVAARGSGMAMQLLTPLEVQSAAPLATANKKTPERNKIIPPEKLTEEMVHEFSSHRIRNHLVHYREHYGIATTIPRALDCRRKALVVALRILKERLCSR